MSDIVTDILTAYLRAQPLKKDSSWDTDTRLISTKGLVLAQALGLSEINRDTVAQAAFLALDQCNQLTATEVGQLFDKYQDHFETEHRFSYAIKLTDALNDFDPDTALESLLSLWIKQLQSNRQFTLSETFPGLSAASLPDIYIEPTFEEYAGDDRLGFGLAASIRHKRNTAKISGIPAIVRRLRGLNMVFADPGSGKTTFTHQLCRHLISNEATGRPMLPVLIRLRDVPGNTEKSILHSFLTRCLGSAAEDDRAGALSLKLIDFFQHCIDSAGPLPLFVLDGLDEYRGPDSWLTDEVGVLSALGSVIVTSRLGVESQLVHLADARYRIRPLELDEMSRLVRSLIPLEPKQQQIFDHLDRYPDLRRLAANPFVISSFCGLHLMQGKQHDDLPRNRTELLDGLAESGFAHYRQSSPGQNRVTPKLRRSINRLAAWMQFDSDTSPEYQFVTEPDLGTYTPEEETTSALAGARLTQKTWRYGYQEFVHPLVQEFFAGSRLIDLLTSKDHAKSVMKELVRQADSPNFQGPLQFAVGLTRLNIMTDGLTPHLISLASRMLETTDPFGVRAFQLARFMVEAGAERFPREDIDRVLNLLWDAVTRGYFDQDFIEAMVSLNPTDIRRRVDETQGDDDPFELTALPKIQAALHLHEDSLRLVDSSRTRPVLAASEARCFRDLVEPLTAETCRQALESAQTDDQWSAASKLVARLGGREAAHLVLEATRRGLPTAADESLAGALGWVSHPAATDVLMAMLARNLNDHDVVDACLFSLSKHVFNYGEQVLGELASNPDYPSYRREAAMQCLGNCFAPDALAVLLTLLHTEQEPELILTILKSIAKHDPLSAVHALQMHASSATEGPSRTQLLKLTAKILREAKDNYTLVNSVTLLAQWFLADTDWDSEPDFTKIALQIVHVDEPRWLDIAVEAFQSDAWHHVATAAIGLAKCKSEFVDNLLQDRLKSIQHTPDTESDRNLPMRTAAAEAIAQSMLQRGLAEIGDLLEYPILKRAVARYALSRRLILSSQENPAWTGRNFWFSHPIEADGAIPKNRTPTASSSIELRDLLESLEQRVGQKQGVVQALGIFAWADQYYKSLDALRHDYKLMVGPEAKNEDIESQRQLLVNSLHTHNCPRYGLPSWDDLRKYLRRLKKHKHINQSLKAFVDEERTISEELIEFLTRWKLL